MSDIRIGRSRALDVYTAGRAIARWFRALERANRQCDATRERRASLPAGSSRAKITSANSKWMRATEYRDVCEKALADLGVNVDQAILVCYGTPGPKVGSTLDGDA